MKFFARKSDTFHASQTMISSYLDSALSNKDMEKIEFHIVSCDVCSQEIDELRDIVRSWGWPVVES